MAKCDICHENEAVIMVSHPNQGKLDTVHLCLKCAIGKKIPGLQTALDRFGVTEETVEEMQQSINDTVEALGGEPDLSQILRMIGKDEMPDEELEESDDSEVENSLPLSIHRITPEEIEKLRKENPGDDAFSEILKAMGVIFPDSQTEEQKKQDNEESSNSEQAKIPSARSFFESLLPAQAGHKDEEFARPEEKTSKRKEPKRKFLDSFGINLTRRSREGKLERLVGREKEVDRVIQILNRRTKNNPALIGEPGVGKTAIAQGLAWRIQTGHVPAKLLGKEVYQLDMTAIVAGTQFRGQFENRMKGLIEEAKQAGNIILVIDELHTIMGAGDAEGSLNAANILKPALASGELSLIGSTTLEEYRRCVEKDSALERRFQKVMIEEPTAEEALDILRGIQANYESHHQVTYAPEALTSAIRLSKRYIQDRFLPDKAIDLLDEAGSKANLHNDVLTNLTLQKMALEGLKSDAAAVADSLQKSKSEEERMPLYQQRADVTSAILRTTQQIEQLEKEFEPPVITEKEIASVVEMWTGIPVSHIEESESEKLLHLEERLHQRVIGQDKAVSAIARAIRRKRTGFGKKDKPASFLFVGPTGVGKTELAKALAQSLFESEKSLIRLDMSEYMEPHTVAKLIGSPPGYVGYDDGGQLTERIRRHPYSVILLDEIEKANKDVFNVLLQVMDDGRLTDSHGKMVDFSNTVLIMTSNAGTTLKGTAMGFGQQDDSHQEARIQEALRNIFRPEFLNRIDETIVFQPLSKSELREIVDLMLREVEESMSEAGYAIRMTPAAKDWLVEKGYDPRYGARPLRRTIQREVEEKLSDLLLSGAFVGALGAKAGVKNGLLQIESVTGDKDSD